MAEPIVTASFTVGTDVEGCHVMDSVTQTIWPNATSEQLAAGCRTAFELGLLITAIVNGVPQHQATVLVSQGTPDSH